MLEESPEPTAATEVGVVGPRVSTKTGITLPKIGDQPADDSAGNSVGNTPYSTRDPTVAVMQTPAQSNMQFTADLWSPLSADQQRTGPFSTQQPAVIGSSLPDETDGFAPAAVSQPQPIPGQRCGGGEERGLANQSPVAPVNIESPAHAETPNSFEQDGALAASGTPHGDSLHGVSAAVRRAKQELMFFASMGDLKRCTILCCTATQLYAADIANCQDWDGRTPLHAAATHGCYQVCKWLLKQEGVPPSPIDKFGHTPLLDAVKSENPEIIALLQKYGAKVKGAGGYLVDYHNSNIKRPNEDCFREWEINPADLVLGEKIGEGEFGTVFRAKWHSSTVAVKMLKRSDKIAMQDFRSELDVLQKMRHPNITQFLGACTQTKPYMLVTEYMPGGSLADLLKSPEYHPSIKRALVMSQDCAKAMAYLHAHLRHMVLHRDLKPANLLLGGIHAARGNATLVAAKYGLVKVADFGLSRITTLMQAILSPASSGAIQTDSPSVNRTDSALSTEARARSENTNKEVYNYTGETGTYRYMAPEVFRHEPYNGKADVYSFAMICYELVEGHRPFSGLSASAAARAASEFDRRPPWGRINRFGKKVSQPVKQLVAECWAPAMDDRPDFATIACRLEVIVKELPEDLDENSLVHCDRPCCSIQ